VAASLNSLGQLALEIGQYEQAQATLEQALREASAVRAVPVMLAALGGLAALLSGTALSLTALEYAALVCAHPAADGSAHYACERLMQRFQQMLPADTFTAAVERGERLSLRAVTEHILAASPASDSLR
jgi:hypothetical protein